MAICARSGRGVRIEAKVNRGYRKAAGVLGVPFTVCRPQPMTDLSDLSRYALADIEAVFTNAKSSGFNFDKGEGFDDVLWAVLADPTGILEGDYLIGPEWDDQRQRVYFTVARQSLLPPHAVLCNRRVSHMRGNSQLDADGGSGEGMPSQSDTDGTYFGVSRALAATGPGEMGLAQNIPVALVPLAGAARGQGEVPSDAPGPGRYRMYLPVSVFPLGSVRNGDVFTDDVGARYQVGTDGWTQLGYRVEMIRLEN